MSFRLLVFFIAVTATAALTCRWRISEDVRYHSFNLTYKLLVRSFMENNIYNTTYFRLRKQNTHGSEDVLILTLLEAEYYNKFLQHPSETPNVLKGHPRNFHLAVTSNNRQQFVKFVFEYPRFLAIEYLNMNLATAIGRTIKSRISQIKVCAQKFIHLI